MDILPRYLPVPEWYLQIGFLGVSYLIPQRGIFETHSRGMSVQLSRETGLPYKGLDYYLVNDWQ